jgi:hypothetical protein
MLGMILGLVCIILGFVSAFAHDAILFSPLVWFVAAIAFVAVLGSFSLGGFTIGRKPNG